MKRDDFISSYTPKAIIAPIKVKRADVFKESIDLYQSIPELVHQLPLRVSFKGEMGVDSGGLGRDFFSCFWEEAYKVAFDGASLLTPAVHAHVDCTLLLCYQHLEKSSHMAICPLNLCQSELLF